MDGMLADRCQLVKPRELRGVQAQGFVVWGAMASGLASSILPETKCVGTARLFNTSIFRRSIRVRRFLHLRQHLDVHLGHHKDIKSLRGEVSFHRSLGKHDIKPGLYMCAEL